MDKMISFLMLAFSVKCGGGTMMRDVIESAVRLALPDELAAAHVAMVKADMRAPTKSCISQSRLIVDGALMLWKRIENRPSTVRYVLADSSPQAKHDWMMSECFEIKEEDMMKAAEAVRFLAATKGNDDPEAAASLVAERHRRSKELRHCVVRHVLPPAALGVARGSLHHKLHALLFQVFLETGSWAAACTWLRGVTSFTTDQGVESLLARAPLPDLSKFFPHIDSDADANSALVLSSGGGPDIQAAAPPVPAAALAVPAAPPAASTLNKLFDYVLWIPGAMHICDNAVEDMTNHLKYFNEFEPHITAVRNYFGTSWLREMFVVQCLADAPDAFKELFNAGAPTIQEW
jgi:hypothetical protein